MVTRPAPHLVVRGEPADEQKRLIGWNFHARHRRVANGEADQVAGLFIFSEQSLDDSELEESEEDEQVEEKGDDEARLSHLPVVCDDFVRHDVSDVCDVIITAHRQVHSNFSYYIALITSKLILGKQFVYKL